ncbi:MAG: hypothetical protein IKH73_00610, partial [Erysipelotrichaceae bacterium]|nr:hypothetical protein [Erysipelotrichaceae bacterium]
RGSTDIYLKKDFLQTLNKGDHQITIQFDDGKAITTLKVQVVHTPDTGDHGGLWHLMTLMSLLAVVCLGRKLRY